MLVLLQIVDDVVDLVEVVDSIKQVEKKETEVLSHLLVVTLKERTDSIVLGDHFFKEEVSLIDSLWIVQGLSLGVIVASLKTYRCLTLSLEPSGFGLLLDFCGSYYVFVLEFLF